MHHLYQTDAYVLKTLPQSEAGKYVLLFTKDFGLILTTAQGLRYEKSKLRFAIQDYSKASVSLVRGKNDFWRLTNAVVDKNLFYSINSSTHSLSSSRRQESIQVTGSQVKPEKTKDERFDIVVRIFKLLERLLSGEEADTTLFEIVDEGMKYLESFEKMDPFLREDDREGLGYKEKLLNIETVFVLRILNRLGYVGNNKNLDFYTVDNAWDINVIEKMNEERGEALESINNALRESQL